MPRLRHPAALLAALLAVTALAGCGNGYFGGGDNKVPLKGERISVLSLDTSLKPDKRIQDVEVRLPRPYRDPDWPQPGGVPTHANYHLAVPGNLSVAWSVDAGEGSSDDNQLLAQPIVARGRVYVLDADADLRAFDAKTGHELWHVDLTPENEDEGVRGGGVAYWGGRLFVTTGFADVFAIDPRTGRRIWKHRVSGPMRAGPTVLDGRVFVVTIANELHTLSAADGHELWMQAGIVEPAGLLGGASPAAEGDVVIVAYSSGELFALRAENGRVAWDETLTPLRRADPVSEIPQIKGDPVIDRGRVIAISNSGRMVSIDLRTGGRVWEQEIAGVHTPWVAGGYIYVVTTNDELVCLDRRDGRVRWVTQLPRFEDPEDKEDPIRWTGPVLVSNRLLVPASDGEIWSVSPYTGRPLGRIKLDSGVLISPAVANGTVYVLTNDATLVALR